VDPSVSSKDRILDLIQANPFISQQELAERLDITRSAVASHIAQLIRDRRLLGRAYVLPTVEPILVAGGANLDRIAKGFAPIAMATSNPVTLRESFGGVARNVAENLARMGLPVRLLTAVGDDGPGTELLRHARDLGIDTGACLVAPGAATGTYTAILQPGGEMVLAMSDMAVMAKFTPEWLGGRRKLWTGARMRVLDLNLPPAVVQELMHDSRQRGATLVAVAVSEPKMDRLPADLHGISVLILNAGELAARTGRPLPDRDAVAAAALEVQAQGLEGIVVTLGAQGVICCGADRKPAHLQALPAEVVDVTGAGDAFSSGVVAGLASDPRDLLRACRIGQRLAVLTLGSRSGVAPDLSPEFLQAFDLQPVQAQGGTHA
jgi:pseudouridine kinase